MTFESRFGGHCPFVANQNDAKSSGTMTPTAAAAKDSIVIALKDTPA